jgi:hypothetical protein
VPALRILVGGGASSSLKRYHPAAFCAALRNAQPMGFYSPQSLVDDARRHGVTVLRPDINISNAKAILHATPNPCQGRGRKPFNAPEHTTSTQPSIMDMKKAPNQRKPPGQGLDHGCAAMDLNPEPAD